MSRLWQGIRVQYLYAKPGFLVFWGIILAIMALQYVGFLYLHFGNLEVKSVAVGHIVGVVIYMGIATGLQCWETLPYALNLGNTRGEFWLGCAVFNCLYSLVMAGILLVLSLLEWAAYALMGWEHQLMRGDGVAQVFIKFLVDSALLAAVTAGVFLAVMLGYRYGWKPFVILVAAFVSSLKLFPSLGHALVTGLDFLFLTLFGSGSPWSLIGGLLVVTVVCYGLAYPLVRGSQVKS